MANKFSNRQQHNQEDWDQPGNRNYNNPYQDMNYGSSYNRPYSSNQWEGRSFNEPMNRPYGNTSFGNQENYTNRDYDIYGSRSSQYGNAGYGQGYGSLGRNDPYGSYDPGFTGRGYDQYRDSEHNRWNQERKFSNHPFSSSRSHYGEMGHGDPEQQYRQEGRHNRRDWWDRTSDEVASWFGDDDAERRRRMDKVSGPHKGKGPRDYHRSDDRIRDDINDRLYDDSFVDASDVEVKVENGDVTLTGTVDSKEIKRRAEDIAEAVSGVSNVSNNLKVSRPVTAVGGTSLYSDKDRRDKDSRDRW